MKDFDLNLLRPLQALLEECSVSRAAVRLRLSQPAMSAALGRLRRHYDDELLVRVGRSMELTPFAEALKPVVTSGLSGIRDAVDVKNTFDPRTTDRRFLIAATDYMTAILAGPLLSVISMEAPCASIDFVPITQVAEDLSCFSRLDALIGPEGFGLPGNCALLFRDEFVVIADGQNEVFRVAQPHLGLLEQVPHAVAYLKSTSYTPAEALLDKLGLIRRVAARLSGLASLPILVSGTDMVAVVPRMLARKVTRLSNLVSMEFPPELVPELAELVYWHPRNDDDPASLWLRSVLTQAVPLLFEAGNARTSTVLVYPPS